MPPQDVALDLLVHAGVDAGMVCQVALRKMLVWGKVGSNVCLCFHARFSNDFRLRPVLRGSLGSAMWVLKASRNRCVTCFCVVAQTTRPLRGLGLPCKCKSPGRTEQRKPWNGSRQVTQAARMRRGPRGSSEGAS